MFTNLEFKIAPDHTCKSCFRNQYRDVTYWFRRQDQNILPPVAASPERPMLVSTQDLQDFGGKMKKSCLTGTHP